MRIMDSEYSRTDVIPIRALSISPSPLTSHYLLYPILVSMRYYFLSDSKLIH